MGASCDPSGQSGAMQRKPASATDRRRDVAPQVRVDKEAMDEDDRRAVAALAIPHCPGTQFDLSNRPQRLAASH